MSHNLSQPEEVEHVLLEMAEYDRAVTMSDSQSLHRAFQGAWSTGYISAYRVERMKTAGNLFSSKR